MPSISLLSFNTTQHFFSMVSRETMFRFSLSTFKCFMSYQGLPVVLHVITSRENENSCTVNMRALLYDYIMMFCICIYIVYLTTLHIWLYLDLIQSNIIGVFLKKMTTIVIIKILIYRF